MKSRLRIGLEALGVLALVVLGGIQIRGPIDVDTLSDPGTATGVVLKEDGHPVLVLDKIPLRSTGGLAVYDLTWVTPDDYGIAGSGITLNVGIEMVRNPANASFDISYLKAQRTASGSAAAVIASAQNLTVASGSSVIRGAASGSNVFNGNYSLWNGADAIVVKSTSTYNASMSGYLVIEARDTRSE